MGVFVFGSFLSLFSLGGWKGEKGKKEELTVWLNTDLFPVGLDRGSEPGRHHHGVDDAHEAPERVPESGACINSISIVSECHLQRRFLGRGGIDAYRKRRHDKSGFSKYVSLPCHCVQCTAICVSHPRSEKELTLVRPLMVSTADDILGPVFTVSTLLETRNRNRSFHK